MNTFIVSCLIGCLSSEAQVSPSKMLDSAQLREALEEYLSRIASCRMHYVLTISQKGEGSPKSTIQYEIVEAFPSYRRVETTEIRPKDGATKTNEQHRYFDGQTLMGFAPGTRTWSIWTQNAPEPSLFSPLNAIGRCLLETRNMSASDCFAHPEYVTVEGEQLLDGVRTIVIKAGPSLPVSARPPGTTEDFWIKLWLAPDLSFVPKQLRLQFSKRHFHEWENFDIEPADDRLRGTSLPFPRRTVWHGPLTTKEFRVEEVVLNPSIPPATFHPTIPDGDELFIDGKKSVRLLTGGEPARERRLDELVAKSGAMIASQVADHKMRAPKPSISSTVIASVVGSVSGVLILVGFFLRRLRCAHSES